MDEPLTVGRHVRGEIGALRRLDQVADALPATISLASREECNPDGSNNSDVVATYLPVWRCSVQSSPWSLIMRMYVCCRAPDWSSASMS